MLYLPEHFSEYLAPDCSRSLFIQSYLSERGVSSVLLPVDGKEHVYVKFPSSQYNPQFKIKTVIAHYDRAQGSPGANDNSAADFCLMDWAVRLQQRADFHNVRMLFTDGEELGAKGIADQGAFSLASLFKRLGIVNDDVYVFDCTGRGTIPVIGKTVEMFKAPFKFRKNFFNLEERTEELLRKTGTGRWLTLPLPYSDNAGFIACGIPAVVITILPEDDADRYLAALIREKSLERFVMNHEGNGTENAERLRSMMPQTWRLFHTPYDNEQNLTPESFVITAKILDALAAEKTVF
ncbi:MAG: M28 family peptidase [Treponema sp.]|nr:M28 family peptidase [Treponema sp.]